MRYYSESYLTSFFQTKLEQLKSAVTPVYAIKLPYPLPYPALAWPFHGRPFVRASLRGPETKLPMPRPTHNHPNIIGGSIESSTSRFRPKARIIPGQVEVNDPAKRPYITQKTYSTVREEDNPQITKTPIVAPTEEIRMQVVAGSRSVNVPMITHPSVVDRLMRSTVNAERYPEAPRKVLAYVGK